MPHRLQPGDTANPYGSGMADLTSWLLRLGTAGAARNAAAACAERRAAEARVDAMARRFAATSPAAQRRISTHPAAS